MFKQCIFTSDLGPLYLVSSQRGLRGAFWQAQRVPLVDDWQEDHPAVRFLAQTVAQLTEYLQGKRRKFELQLDVFSEELPMGTAFQMHVWQVLMEIPYGTTVSYGDIAYRLDKPQAVRAVGTAVGKNPLCVIIPCHRVINADDSLGGYSGGPLNKAFLLELEKKHRK